MVSLLDSCDKWIRQYGSRFAGITTVFGSLGYFLGRIFGPSLFAKNARESYLNECAQDHAAWRWISCNRYLEDIPAERIGHEAFKYGEEYGPIIGSTAMIGLSYLLVTGIVVTPWLLGKCRNKRDILSYYDYKTAINKNNKDNRAVIEQLKIFSTINNNKIRGHQNVSNSLHRF